MSADVPRSTKWKVRIIAFGGLLDGLVFLAIPPLVDWSLVIPLWIFGVPLTGIFGYMIGYGLIFRLRHPDPAERAAAKERVLDTGPGASPQDSAGQGIIRSIGTKPAVSITLSMERFRCGLPQ